MSAPITAAGNPDPMVPAEPPADVRAAVDVAAQRVEDLAAADRELHFETDPVSGRMVIEVRDLRGNRIRAITPSEAFAVLAGLSDVC